MRKSVVSGMGVVCRDPLAFLYSEETSTGQEERDGSYFMAGPGPDFFPNH